MKIRGLEAIHGTVRWLSGRSAGVGFTCPLHPAVFELLLRRMRGGHEISES